MPQKRGAMPRVAREIRIRVILLSLVLALASSVWTQNNITYIYDESGRLVGVIDPSGNVAVYKYDAAGNILSISRSSSSQVSIIQFTPKSGPVGNTVTISGTGFSTTTSQDTVTFNGVTASVTSASTTQITTSVPAGATTGPITVTAPAGSATSSMPFTVTASSGAPTIIGFTPTIGSAGTTVTVNGTNFQTAPANDKVKYNISEAAVKSATTTSITTSVPQLGTSGRISLATPFGKTVSSGDFFIPPSPYGVAAVGFTGRMSIGGTSTVTLNTANQIGLMLFDGTAGQRISANFPNAAFNGCFSVYVFNPDGTTLASGSSCSGSYFVDATNLLATATYTIEVAPYSNVTGSVPVTLYNVVDVTGPITPGGSGVPVNLSTPGQNANLTFTGSAGQRVSANFPNSTFNGCWTASILNPDGTTLVSNYTCASSNFLDATNLPTAGTYTVKVDPAGPTTGSVTVSLYNVVDVTGSIAINGSSVLVTITTPGQNAYLTFSGTGGQKVSANFGGGTLPNATFNGCWTASILNPDSTTLASSATCSESTSIPGVTLPTTGTTYTVKVDPWVATTGSVTVKLTSP